MEPTFISTPYSIYYVSFDLDLDNDLSAVLRKVADWLDEPSRDYLNHKRSYYLQSIDYILDDELHDYIKLTMTIVTTYGKPE